MQRRWKMDWRGRAELTGGSAAVMHVKRGRAAVCAEAGCAEKPGAGGEAAVRAVGGEPPGGRSTRRATASLTEGCVDGGGVGGRSEVSW